MWLFLFFLLNILGFLFSKGMEYFFSNLEIVLIEFDDDVVVDPTVLAASLGGLVPPGLLLAEALDVLGPMVLHLTQTIVVSCTATANFPITGSLPSCQI